MAMDEPSSGSADQVPAWPEEAIPVLHVDDADVAVRWYQRLGFREEWRHRFEPGFPAFVSIQRGSPGVRIFLSEHHGDATSPGSVYLRVEDVRPIATEHDAPIEDALSRVEVHLVDPDGNRITVGARTGRAAPDYSYPNEADG